MSCYSVAHAFMCGLTIPIDSFNTFSLYQVPNAFIII